MNLTFAEFEKVSFHYRDSILPDSPIRIDPSSTIAFCIGTDRSTGDSLGPLVGWLLEKRCVPVKVFGKLGNTIHAANLTEILAAVKAQYPNHTILAIDACLGKKENVGKIRLKHGPFQPGTGVNREDLPEVGDINLTGVTNVSGFMEYFVLQNTELSVVMGLAERIVDFIIDRLFAPEYAMSLT